MEQIKKELSKMVRKVGGNHANVYVKQITTPVA